MSLIRWNNHRNFPTFSNFVDRFFDERLGNINTRTGAIPSVNISENEEIFKLEVAAPGLKKENFKLDLRENTLTVSAKKEFEKKEEDKNEKGQVKYTHREFAYSSFERSFTLPNTVKQDNIEANYEDGVLNITLPKKEEAKQKTARQIEII